MNIVGLPGRVIGPWVRLLHATGVDTLGVEVMVWVLVTVGVRVKVGVAVAVVVPVLVGVRVTVLVGVAV